MKSLREISPGEASIYGGKAAGLARLMAEGARVPEGFATEAGVTPPAAWAREDREEFLRRSGELLKSGPVAVRSSALAEDSAERSFAGLFETLLGVKSPIEALEAAGRSIASGASARVLTYAKSEAPMPVGVVVQAMIPASAAGVCFTLDPAGKDTALLVEAVAGMGEALVSGRVAPERWRCYLSGLGEWQCHPEGHASLLGAKQAAEIAKQAKTFEKAFGRPLDLEWAIDADESLWWLQARPITALKAPPGYVIQRSCLDAEDGPVTVWSNWNVRETLPDPLPPLTWTFWVESILPTVGVRFFGFEKGSVTLKQLSGLDLINGRIYFNMNALLAIPVLGRLAARLLQTLDARSALVVRALRKEGVLVPRRIPGSRLKLFLTFSAASMKWLFNFRRTLAPRRALRSLERDAATIGRRKTPAELSEAELIRELRIWEQPEHRGLLLGLHMETAAIMIYHIALKAFRDHPRAAELLATGIPANPTTQISLGIEVLAEAAAPFTDLFASTENTGELLARIGASPSGAEWLEKLHDFLARYGHRGPQEFDLGAARWEEDPGMILGLVRARLQAPEREGVREKIERLAAERRAALSDALAASPFWRRPYLSFMARLVELYMPLREAPKHYGMFVFTRIRRCALELGRRLAQRGLIERADDVFFIEMAELETSVFESRLAGELRASVCSRRSQFERFRGERAPDLLRSDGVPVWEEPSTSESREGLLCGTPISAGKAVGPVRVLSKPDPSAIRDGDVLVMVFADPGWTPLFPRASAIVMEVGGLMCHAAVVAREIGVPAVFGVKDAAKILHDGQRVTVDGGAGTVTLGEG